MLSTAPAWPTVDADWIDLRWQEDSKAAARLCVVILTKLARSPKYIRRQFGEYSICGCRTAGDFHTYDVVVEVRRRSACHAYPVCAPRVGQRRAGRAALKETSVRVGQGRSPCRLIDRVADLVDQPLLFRNSFSISGRVKASRRGRTPPSAPVSSTARSRSSPFDSASAGDGVSPRRSVRASARARSHRGRIVRAGGGSTLMPFRPSAHGEERRAGRCDDHISASLSAPRKSWRARRQAPSAVSRRQSPDHPAWPRRT